MLSRRSKWLLGAGLAIGLGLTTATAMAVSDGPGKGGRLSKEIGQRVAAQARLSGEKAVKFMKVWEESAEQSRAKRKQLREAVKALAAAHREGKKGAELTRPLDAVQAAFLGLVDEHGKRIESLRAVLTPAEQARLVLGAKGHKLAALPGMKQAIPALVKHLRGEFLASVEGLDPAARAKLEAIGEKFMGERSKLVEQRLELVKKLQTAGSEAKDNAALMDQIAANGAALRETVGEQLTELRKGVPADELVRVLAALKEKAGSLRGKMKHLREAAQGEKED